MEALAIILAALFLLGSAMWLAFKFFAAFWLVGKGCEMLGNHLQLQAYKLEEKRQQHGDSCDDSDLFTGSVPEGYGRHISTVRPSRSGGGQNRPGLTVIPGGKR